MDRGAWWATVHGATKSRTQLSNFTHSLTQECLKAPQVIKNLPANAGRYGFDPWVGKIPWRRAWQPIPVFLPGESPWTEEPGGLQSVGSQRIGHD